MHSKKIFISKNSGFTLVELMVVVAIIGLLSAVAIPNFRKYQAKSKMSEAKLQLSSLYTAQIAFFSEFNIFATCLNYMGYNPSPEMSQRYYAVGFDVAANINTNAWTSATNSGLQSGTAANTCSRTLAAASITDAGGISYFGAGKGTGSAIVTSTGNAHLCNTSIGTQQNNSTTDLADGMTFVASAAGIIDGNFVASTTSSCLTIDNNKKFQVRRNGY
jgi:type IV pilus assembly protein PilA